VIQLVKLIDLEAEQRVISSMMFSEEACIEAMTFLEDKDFSDTFHLAVFSTVSGLFTRGVKPTYTEVAKEGLKTGIIIGQQDMNRLREIAEKFIDSENIIYWTEEVRTKSKLRHLDFMLRKYQNRIEVGKDSDAEEVLSEASEEFSDLSVINADEDLQDPGVIATIGYDLISQKTTRYREAVDANPYGAVILDGAPTGIKTLDEITLGYKPGDLIILGAQTGHGKTAFALNSAKAASIDGGMPCLYINTEMSVNQIALRWACILSGIRHDKIRNGAVTNEELQEIGNAYATLTNSGIYTAHIPNLTPAKLTSIARRAKIRKDVQLIIIDYIGRMDTLDPRLQEWQVLHSIVKAQKQLAQNLECAVMCLVQLNYDGTLQGAKKMKNEADLMLKLVPVSEETVQGLAKEKGIIYDNWNYDLEIDKNRDGPSGNRIPLHFDMAIQKITQATRKGEAEMADDEDAWLKYGKEIKRG
jgi:replicative DNA helicase